MTTTLSTYIALPGNAKEAFEHWAEIFDGELELMQYGDMQLEGMPFEPPPEAVAHATLTIPGGTISGGDAMEQVPLRDTAYSLLLSVADPAAARVLIDRLVAGGGQIGMPFEQAPWGAWYGQVFDRFGVMWAFDAPAGS